MRQRKKSLTKEERQAEIGHLSKELADLHSLQKVDFDIDNCETILELREKIKEMTF